MKKLLMLALLCYSSYGMTYSDEELVKYEVNRYAEIWTEVATKDYNLALYNLNKIMPINAEDDMHQRLMKLYIFMKMNNKMAEYQMLQFIDQQAYYIYLDENDCE